jgi:signal-transduction protein with cAMP-binding, CBS, and nucleotidyltransferase domain
VCPSASAQDVAAALTEGDVGMVAIFSVDRVVGVVSERDITHAVAAGRDLRTTSAAELASTSLIWCDATATVAEVSAEMMEQYVRHVLVEEDGELLGVVSARDLLGAYAAADTVDGPEPA